MTGIHAVRHRLITIAVPALAVGLSLSAPGSGGAPTAAASLRPAAQSCPAGSVPEAHAPGGANLAWFCRSASRPDTVTELASLNAQLRARELAPYGQVAPGAFAAGVEQSRAVLPAGSVAGSGNGWSPAGPSPLCDGHSNDTSLCPLKDNTSLAESNGDYTIALLGHKTLSGRITSFAGDPGNPDRLFAAPAVGGVFETTNGGSSWHSIADNLPTQSMGAVAYDRPLHRIFAGTGDNSFGGDAIQGLGIFYSDNDGRTWSASSGIAPLSVTFRIVAAPADAHGRTVYAATSRGLYRSDNGGAGFYNLNLPTSPPGYTVPDPTRGGAQVSCAGNTTAPLCFFASIVTDVVVKSSGSGNAPAGAVMAVVGWRAGQKIDLNADGTQNTSCQLSGASTPCEQAPQNGLYLSDTGARGSFQWQSHTGSPSGMDFAPNNIVGRTSLGIADGAGQNNDAVFAMVQDSQKLNHCIGDPVDTNLQQICQADVQALGLATVLDGAYATYDFGKTWTKIMDYTELKNAGNTALIGVPGYGPGVQSWYNNWIKPDPTVTDSNGNPTRVLFGLEEIWENNVSVPGVLTTPYLAYSAAVGPVSPWLVIGRYWNDCGGENLTGGVPCNPTLNNPPSSPAKSTTHPDQHAFLFVPDGSGGVTLYAGNDGGAYRQHVAKGVDFSNDSWGDGINNGLYTLQPYDAEISQDGTIVAGLQDNGEMRIAPDGREMHTLFGGDGFFNTIDPTNSSNIIEEYTYGITALTLNGGKDWYNIDAGCGSDNAQFSTSLDQDPTMPGHIVEGCTQILEAGGGAGGLASAYTNPCAVPPGADPFQCQLSNTPWTPVFDLGTVANPGQPRPKQCTNGNTQSLCDPYNVPSAVGVRGENIYVGYCGYCDIVTGGVPFKSGIATNVGGSQPPQIGSGNGWHIASANCSSCHTPNGKLPQRFITSIQLDPGNPRTVYVTMGGYARRWIPPGSLGDDVTNVGVGHIFVSHDAGENFTDISGNLPDLPANWVLVHGSQLVVANDVGVYIAATKGGKTWAHLGNGLPAAPIFTLRLQPGNPDRMIAATYGRGIWQYSFSARRATATGGTQPTTTTVNPGLPNTSALARPQVWPAVLPTGLASLGSPRRRRRAVR